MCGETIVDIFNKNKGKIQKLYHQDSSSFGSCKLVYEKINAVQI